MSSIISDRGRTRFIDICAIFTAACLRKSTDAVVLPFEVRVHPNLKVSANDTLMTTARTLASIGGGGTNVGAPIEYLLEKNINVDVFIGITDGEDWAGRGFTNYWREYRKKINPNAKAFLITIAPYRHMVAPKSEPGVYFIFGWSDNVLPYIISTVQGSQSQMDEVRAVTLADPSIPVAVVEGDGDESTE
jgi:60 kDa SS-A/Ro ribonucleoprotein